MTISIILWMTHLFVWGFGQYLPFNEVGCEFEH